MTHSQPEIQSTALPTFQDLLTALAHPACYPYHPVQVEVVQTHISAVFLAGDEVYKLKKPIH
jgi:aminoglycoside phosphotransferase family enzyme